MNTRRDLLFTLGAVVLAPQVVFAQSSNRTWRIGLLWETGQFAAQYLEAFKAGLRELKYIEGRDYLIEQRTAQSLAAIPEMAAQVVALKPDLILTQGALATVALSKATALTPIVVATIGDPVGIGLADSLRRPGRNVTGLSIQSTDLKVKHLDLLRQIAPQIRVAAFLYDPDNASSRQGWPQFETNCRKLRLTPIDAPVRSAEDISAVFSKLLRERPAGIVVSAGAGPFDLRAQIISQAAAHRIPVIYPRENYAEGGGLISYGPDYPDMWRRAAAYVDKIFRGAKPGDLPIEQPTTFEMVLNMKTAKALGVKIPQSILVQATRVIE
jgi:putative ABC transport system substrate-binding protein